MKKNIIIKQDGTQTTFNNVEKIKLKDLEGEAENWVWLEGTALNPLVATANGTYIAADDGYYGYSTVTAKGVGATVFRAKAVTQLNGQALTPGNEYVLQKDASTGQVSAELLPSQLRITQNPTKTQYADGETINLAGIALYAKAADGTTWEDSQHQGGLISVSDIDFTPHIAQADKIRGDVATDGTNTVYYKKKNSARISTNSDFEEYEATDAQGTVYAFCAQSHITSENKIKKGIYIVSPESFVAEVNINGRTYHIDPGSFEYGGNTVYFIGRLAYESKDVKSQNAPVNTGTDLNVAYLAWLACYGTRSGEDQQDIILSWERPADKKTLKTILSIEITNQ